MISKRVVLVGTAVVGVSYVLAIDSLGPHRAGPGPQDAADPATSVLATRALAGVQPAVDLGTRRELAALSSGVAQLKTELSTLREQRQNAPVPAATAEPPLATDEQVQVEHDQRMAEIERAFEREPRDAAWATGTTQLLRQTVETEPLMLAALRGIDCRSISCRMEVYDDGSPAFTESFPALLHHMGAILPEVRFDHAELAGSAQLHTLYMSKSSSE
jgi:hypothetical protein